MIDRVLNGRYKLSSLLGEGGMAMAYEAEDLVLGRKVAVKVLREQFASDPGFLARFQREARAAAALAHPGIVTVFDVGSDAGTHYIVMELVDGRTLKELIRQEGPLSAARAIDLGRQICEALEYAHQHGLVHRDVKSHNILVGHDGRARIADFGIAVALGESSLTQSGVVVGSAQYISPEQARGEPTTALSDLYSAGVVLYEMATGRLPFEGETSVAVAVKHLQEAPAPPRRLNPRIPESLQALILKAMAKSPAERFASAAEMASALLACARAGMEATQVHALDMEELPPSPRPPVPPSPGEQRPGAGERGAPPERLQRASAPVPAGRAAPTLPPVPPRQRRRGSGGWMVLLVVFAAFLCTLGAIPVAILAYSNGTAGRLFPGLAAPRTPSPAPASTTQPAVVPTATATAEPTPQPSPTPAPSPTAVPVRVPNLVGMAFPQARQSAQARALEVVIAGEVYDPRIPVAAVVSQKPSADAPVERGTRIEVVVSLGREILSVPRVVGDTAAIARGKLQAAGFGSKIVEETNDRVPAGVVLAQNPAPEAKADRGAEVVLTVSSGREKVAVPSLVGLPEAAAQDAIVRAGLTRTYVNYQDFTFVPPGSVLSQEPKPGTMVEKGSTVFIAVRRPQAPTPLPRATESRSKRNRD